MPTYSIVERIRFEMKEMDFIRFNQVILMDRIKIVSYMLIFTYPLFIILDFFLLQNMSQSVFHRNLIIIHLIGFILSLVFILIYKNNWIHQPTMTIYFYITLYILIGAISSLNSQLLTGNINVYTLIVIAAAVIFPIHPRKYGMILLPIHLLFVWGLTFLDDESNSLLMKQINSTGTVVIGLMINYTFYSYRKKDYVNQSKIRASQDSFFRLFRMNPSPMILLNTENNQVELINNQAVEFYQLQNADVASLDSSLIFNHKEEMHLLVQKLLETQAVEKIVKQQPFDRWAMYQFELIDYLGTQCLLIGMTDITHLKKKEEELVEHATIDMLTGVKNRRAGMDYLQELVGKSEPFILCFIDINHLKEINDQEGHAVGDELLREVSSVIKNQIGSKDIIFRLGGDEFIVIFVHKQAAEAEVIWSKILKELSKISLSKETSYPITASHGYYHFHPSKTHSISEMIEMADMEMYKEKILYKRKILATRK
jgi:diguanylate cyclase (GGDEF)-like protein